MKVLLDECTPRILKRRLTGFEVSTVQDVGWAGIKNGELLALAENQFDVFITTDRNLRNQQNLTGRRLAIIELPTNQVPIVAKLAPAIQDALGKLAPGQFVEIPLP
jgi:predicted nuclease of predicted toxin-antitoxin system